MLRVFAPFKGLSPNTQLSVLLPLPLPLPLLLFHIVVGSVKVALNIEPIDLPPNQTIYVRSSDTFIIVRHWHALQISYSLAGERVLAQSADLHLSAELGGCPSIIKHTRCAADEAQVTGHSSNWSHLLAYTAREQLERSSDLQRFPHLAYSVWYFSHALISRVHMSLSLSLFRRGHTAHDQSKWYNYIPDQKTIPFRREANRALCVNWYQQITRKYFKNINECDWYNDELMLAEYTEQKNWRSAEKE